MTQTAKFLPTWHYASRVLAMALCLSAGDMYQNSWTDAASFWHTGLLQTLLYCFKEIRVSPEKQYVLLELSPEIWNYNILPRRNDRHNTLSM